MEELIVKATPFLEKIFRFLSKDGIDVSKYELDHICYRTETTEQYDELKKTFFRLGKILTEEEIGGRPIATFKLNEPIIFVGHKISCLELPSPKAGSFYPRGYEHAEFVIDISFDELIKKYPNVKFDTRAITKPVNADISIKYDGCSVKFHHDTLEYVIENLQ